jgi:flagellar M-ring protein FliF
MADATTAPRGLLEIPGLRQAMLLAGLSAALAAALWLVFWSQGQNYSALYSGLSERENAQVVDALTAAGVPYKLGANGEITVPEDKVREARMKLAAQGLPESDALGVELIQKDPGFGTSQFMENARYQLAMETELARTIVKLQGVQNARVHLALPRASAFVRDRRKATASVMLQLYAGRRLEPGQVQAIIHLVASSVPDLEAGDVTVVDQNGSLLSSQDGADPLALSAKQLEYTRALEKDYVRRIEELLSPLLGAGRVRAGVNADLDFTVTEQTREDFDPAQQVVRSEQTAQDQRSAGDAAQGVPGALSNQPPQTAALPAGAQGAAGAAAAPTSVSQRATRNFEIDRTLSHTKQPTGTVKRLSVAVVLDNKVVVGADGKTSTKALTADEVTRYTQLVKEAIGYDEARGDRVQVVNASFTSAEPPAPVAEEPWYSNPLYLSLARQGTAVLLVLALAFVVLRPIMKNLFAPPRPPVAIADVSALPAGDIGADRVTLSSGGAVAALPNYEQHVAVARSVASQDPKRAAAVVKEWVSADVR